HVVVDVSGLEGDDLFELRDGLLENRIGATVRRRVLIAELAKINAAEQLVGGNVIRLRLEQSLDGVFGVGYTSRAEVKIRQSILQFGRAGIAIERVLVLFDGPGDVVGTTMAERIVLVNGSQRIMIISLGTAGGGRIAGGRGLRGSGGL